jgi:hypothetical protein
MNAMRKLLAKNAIILGLVAACVAIAGCDDQARDFAQKTKVILDQRSEQLTRKIAAEKKAYDSSASQAFEDHRALVDSSLQNERNERSDALAADYEEGRKPVSLWRKDLSDYARIDYEANRELLLADMDANTRFLQDFDDLKIEQDKVDALSKLLAALAQKPSLKDDINAISSFAGDTKTEFDKKVCSQLKSQIKVNDPTKDVAAAAYKNKNCDAVLKAP